MDWNQDGHVDILSGCYWSNDADAAHIQILAGVDRLDFAPAAALLTASGVPLTNVKHTKSTDDPNDVEWRNICTHQHAVDYDGDGDLDLVVGCIGSEFFFVENSGGSGSPALSDHPKQLEVKVPGGHGGPHLVDWDGDGDLDLLTGSGQGGVFLSSNVGMRQVPEWAPFQQLVAPSGIHEQSTDSGDEIVPSSSTRVWATDWNGDGQLDLLVGDNVTITTRKPGVSEAEFKRLQSKFQKDLNEVQIDYSKVSQRFNEAHVKGDVSKALQEELESVSSRYSEVYGRKRQFLNERRTGFVWLFLRAVEPRERLTKVDATR